MGLIKNGVVSGLFVSFVVGIIHYFFVAQFFEQSYLCATSVMLSWYVIGCLLKIVNFESSWLVSVMKSKMLSLFVYGFAVSGSYVLANAVFVIQQETTTYVWSIIHLIIGSLLVAVGLLLSFVKIKEG